MKILHITYAFPPILNIADGITNVVYHVTRELARRGHEISVYASNTMNLNSTGRIHEKEVAISSNLHAKYSNYLFRQGTFFFTPSVIRILKDTINEFDIVHIHDARSFQGITAYFLANKFRVPFVFQPHGSYISTGCRSTMIEIGKRFLDKVVGDKIVFGARKIIALSPLESQQYQNIGVPREKIEVIPNGVNLSEYIQLPPRGSFKKKYSILEGRRIILYVGRIHSAKGIDFLIKTYARLVRSPDFGDLLLVIGGPDDGYLGKARTLASALKVSDRILFTGLLTERDKLSAYVDSLIVVCPERFNVFLLVPLEAAACGTPVIVSNTNYIGQVVREGAFGSLVRYGDTNDFASVLAMMLGDRSLLKEMGVRGRKFVLENLNWAKITRKLEGVYEQARKWES